MALQINIDNGGTLTDICIMMDDTVKKTKVLTTRAIALIRHAPG